MDEKSKSTPINIPKKNSKINFVDYKEKPLGKRGEINKEPYYLDGAIFPPQNFNPNTPPEHNMIFKIINDKYSLTFSKYNTYKTKE